MALTNVINIEQLNINYNLFNHLCSNRNETRVRIRLSRKQIINSIVTSPYISGLIQNAAMRSPLGANNKITIDKVFLNLKIINSNGIGIRIKLKLTSKHKICNSGDLDAGFAPGAGKFMTFNIVN